MTCPQCRERGITSEVVIKEVIPIARSIQEKVTFACTVCDWEKEGMF